MQRIQGVSHIVEPTENTSPVINTATRGVNFGLYTQSWGTFPGIGMPKQAEWKTSGRFVDEFYTQRHELTGQIHYLPTDGLIPYYALCDKAAGEGGVNLSGSGTKVKTMYPIDSGNTESFTTRYHTYDGARGHYQDMAGCRVRQWSSHINYEAPDKVLQDSVFFDGQGFAASGSTNAGDLPFANGEALAAQKPFKVDSSHYVKWDTGSANINIAPNLLNFQHTVQLQNHIQWVDSNMKPSWINSGKRMIGLSFDMYRNDANPHAVMVDFLDSAASPVYSGYGVSMKIYKTAAQYMQYDYAGVIPFDVQMTHANLNNKEIPVYRVQCVVQEISAVTDDGVTASATGFYGIDP